VESQPRNSYQFGGSGVKFIDRCNVRITCNLDPEGLVVISVIVDRFIYIQELGIRKVGRWRLKRRN
jgi:hypothetical protein